VATKQKLTRAIAKAIHKHNRRRFDPTLKKPTSEPSGEKNETESPRQGDKEPHDKF
jgi:hypothetical protein